MSDNSNPRTIRVLNLEDRGTDAELIRRELEHAGFQLQWQRVQTEAEFLNCLNQPWDIVLADYNLPQFDAPSALRLLRERNLDLPFIVVSGTIGEEVAVAAMKLGANDYLLKDRLARLGAAVSHAMAERQLRDEQKRAQEELRQAHQKLQHVLAHSPAVIYTLKLEGENITPVLVGENIGVLSGLPAAQCSQYQWWLESLHPEDRDRIVTRISQALKEDGYSLEYRIRHKDGTYRWVEDKNRVLRDSAGRPVEAVGVWTDITSRKAAEFELSERNRLTALAADVGRAFTVNESYRKTLQNCADAVRANLGAVLSRIWTLDETGIYLELQATSGEDHDPEERYRRVPRGELKIGMIAKEGRSHWTNDLINDPQFTNVEWARRERIVAFAGFPLIVQEQLVGVMALFSREPLTELTRNGIATVANQIAIGIREMRAERSLRESEERYRDLFENAYDLIQNCAADGRLLYVNQAWRQTLGFTDEEVRRLCFQDFVPIDRQKDCQEVVRRALAGEQIKLAELEFLSKDGRRIAVEGSISTKTVEGKPVSLRGIFRDVTERKKWEAQSLRNQRMESIGTLAGGIAHDLNNALAPILMSLELLRLKFPDQESQAMLETIAGSAQRGADMVKQVLTFSRGMEGERIPVQLRHLVSEMHKIISQTFPKNIQLRARIPKNLRMVRGDPTQLHQVLLNLCVNARDAMPQGGTLSLKAENHLIDEHFARMNSQAKPGLHVMVRVSDTGTGIAPEFQERIFDPFFTTKPLGQGTGLGLSTVLGIVKAHEGWITLYSEVGKGTEFKIYLPALASGVEEPAALKARRAPAGNDELLLLVDDEASIRTIGEQTLRTYGYRVLSACDGAQAVAVCAQNMTKLSLVIIDMNMPIMDGLSAIRAIRSLLPEIKIIAASGLPVELSSNTAEFLHPNAILHKPYTAEQLLKLIREVLDAPGFGPKRM